MTIPSPAILGVCPPNNAAPAIPTLSVTLYTAAASRDCHFTLGRPRCLCLHISPVVLAQPNGSLTRLRLTMLAR